jgi:hypothetical protein
LLFYSFIFLVVMKCKICGEDHEKSNDLQYCVVRDLHDSGYPTHSRGYNRAHAKANIAEKAAFGNTSYNAMKKVDAGLKKHELAGKNTKTGKIEVSKKVPKKYRAEVALHEAVESKVLRKKK